MKEGKRHGWGVDLPMQRNETVNYSSFNLTRIKFSGIWKGNKRIIDEDNQTHGGTLFRTN